ncbi:MAG TPA: LuxR C-terminal-related transcriptional regulator [Acetobacteraceae bacterium]|nr:LuxR C-terminal-related transcriptional regulator [Acetobacteraceae bacterium]
MHDHLSQSIAREVLRLALQIAPTLGQVPPSDADATTRPKDLSLQLYRQRLLALDRGLTGREIDVCARSLSGMTAEGIGLELEIKKSSVVTYRKRAYERLGISSQHELFRMLA